MLSSSRGVSNSPERGCYWGYWDGGPEGFLEQMPETPSIDAASNGGVTFGPCEIRPSWDTAHYYEGGSVPTPGERVLSDRRWPLLEVAQALVAALSMTA